METVITPVFWLLLWNGEKVKPQFGTFFKMLALIMDHCFPFIALSIEFYINAICFSRRHLILLISLCMTYLVVNLVTTKVTGIPPYPFMNWEGFVGYVVVPV